jgi:hypothetical protein
VVLVVLVAIPLQGAIQELRVARGDVGRSRAAAMVETAIADLMASPADSALLTSSRGATRRTIATSGADTAFVALQFLGAATVRVVVAARSWIGGEHSDVRNVVFLRILADSAGPPGALRLRRLPGWWWAPAQ